MSAPTPRRALVLAGVSALAGVVLALEVQAGAAIDAEEVWRDLQRIVGFGPRPSGSEALTRTRDYIAAELKKVGIRTWTQSFVAQTPLGPVRMANLVAEIPGRRTDVIVFGGHYDTKYYPNFRFVGANDGGSSTALLLELGRRLAGAPHEATIWLMFFDGEEDRDPLYNRAALHGSRHAVEALAETGDLKRVRAAIVVDMIGDRDLDIRRESGSAVWLTDILWATARRLGHQRHFLDQLTSIEDDHVPFVQSGVPAALLIDYTYGHGADGRGFWHTADDTPDKLSPQSLKVVGDVLLNALPEIEAALRRP